MRSVRLRSSGLACALGGDLPGCLPGLRAGSVAPHPLLLEGFEEETLGMPYYRIPDGAELFDPGRFDALLAKVGAEALAGSGLTKQEIQALPIFVGSSAFSVTQSEFQYRERLRRDPGAACALPLVGFQHIASSLQASLGIQGESYAFNTACTASANALIAALRMIQMGRFSHALVIGFELANATTLAGFSGLQLIAPQLKPFDLNRGGHCPGGGRGRGPAFSHGRAPGPAPALRRLQHRHP